VESDEIVAGAKKNGVPVEYVLFPDEGHGFVKKENQMKAAEVTLKFLDEHLRNAKPMGQKPAF
jgi:dipeptidyl aminopeptidase/acylaminoacyl peptidase